MGLALLEARKGLGLTSPNPAVGALIANGDRILSSGYHQAAGQPHAEIEALRALGDPALARGADLYVTLEPCSTHGRTPPCTEAILAAGFRRVFIGALDPNPAHAGRGLEILRAGGCEVHSGIMEAECAALNEAWNHWIVHRTPWVIAKAALTLDGAMIRPAGEGQWLTSTTAREHAHRTLRAQCDAILVGAETVRRDNPRLTVRLPEGAPPRPQPWRIVLSRGAGLPEDAHILTDEFRERTLVYRGPHLDLAEMLAELGARPITSLLVEGGARALTEFFRLGLVHRAQFYYAPLISGAPESIFPGTGRLGWLGASSVLENVEIIDLDHGEFCVSGLVKRP